MVGVLGVRVKRAVESCGLVGLSPSSHFPPRLAFTQERGEPRRKMGTAPFFVVVSPWSLPFARLLPPRPWTAAVYAMDGGGDTRLQGGRTPQGGLSARERFEVRRRAAGGRQAAAAGFACIPRRAAAAWTAARGPHGWGPRGMDAASRGPMDGALREKISQCGGHGWP